jgi:hypothetical protein
VAAILHRKAGDRYTPGCAWANPVCYSGNPDV